MNSKPRKLQRPSYMAANTAFFIATIGLMIIPFAATVVYAFVPGLDGALVNRNASNIYDLVFVLLPVLMYIRLHPDTKWALRLNRPRPKHVLVAIGMAAVGLLLFNDIGTLWMIGLESLGYRLRQSSVSIGAGTWGMVSAVMSMALLPAITEELQMRSLFLGAWERRGSKRALIISALLFALLHGSVEGFPVEFLVGLVLGFLAINCASVVVPMVYHFTHNFLIIAISASAPSSSADSGLSLYESIGGAAGVAQVCLMMAVLSAVFALLMLMASSDREQIGLPFGRPEPEIIPRQTWREQLVLLAAILTAVINMVMGLMLS